MVRRFGLVVILSFGIAALPEIAHVHGNPAILYWSAVAFLLDILCLIAILHRPSKWRAYACSIFLILCTLLWTVMLTNRTLPLLAVESILTVFPMLYFGLYFALTEHRHRDR